jgi:sporulation protein YlmC with PRC-barrel domain
MSQLNKESSDLISSDKVEGTPVYNGKGEKLGSVHDIMLHKRSGKVAYAVMSFGGFLGMGEDYHPLPWDMLTYSTEQDGYIVDIDKERLEKAPHFDSSDDSTLYDPAYQREIYDYYGINPVI